MTENADRWTLPVDRDGGPPTGYTSSPDAPGRRRLSPSALGWIIGSLSAVGLLFGLVPVTPDGTTLALAWGAAAAILLVQFGLARLDRDRLRAAKLPSAAPAWTLLTPVIYLAVRAARLRRVGVRAAGPVALAAVALGINLLLVALGILLLVTLRA